VNVPDLIIMFCLGLNAGIGIMMWAQPKKT